MPDNGPRPQDISATFAKGLSVLKAFDAAHTSLGFSDIARLCDIDRAVARRLVLTLDHLGYVRRTGKTFELTPKVLVLAGGYLQGRQFGKLIQPVLDHHARALGDTISLAVLEDDNAVYVAQGSADSTRVSFGFTLGSRLPLLHSAIGRALLIPCPREETHAYIARLPVSSLTAQTVTDRTAIASAVDIARRDGAAIVADEFEPNVTGFAVPVPTSHSFGFAIGTSRLSAGASDDTSRIIATLHACARDLSGVL